MPVLNGIVLQGASLLPTGEVKAAFGRLYGRQLNVNDMHASLDRLNRWYEQRGVLGQVSAVSPVVADESPGGGWTEGYLGWGRRWRHE